MHTEQHKVPEQVSAKDSNCLISSFCLPFGLVHIFLFGVSEAVTLTLNNT
jgi:hypothetical protein